MTEDVYVLPTSFAQQRLWFIDQLSPGNPAYNIVTAVRLRGILDANALEQTFQAIVSRHESLRTTFSSIDGEPMQIVSPQMTIKLSRHQIAADSSDRQRIIQEFAHQEGGTSFDLQKGPLLRATLVKVDENDHVLVMTIHHIVSDAWSMGVLVRELSHFYLVHANAPPNSASLPELPIQYGDFAIWQRDTLTGPRLENHLAFWREQLTPPPARLNLPIDRPRTRGGSRTSGKVVRLIPSEMVAGIQRLGRSEGATSFMTFLAAFQVLLLRYTDQSDVTVGTSIANRNRDETECLIGFFVNTLVMRADLSDAKLTFRQFLQQTKSKALQAYEFQDFPFEKLVEELSPAREQQRSPFFDVLFSFQNAPLENVALSELELELVKVDNDVAKYDLLLNLWESPLGVSASLAYDRDLFDETTVDQMLDRYASLLKNIGDAPDVFIRELPFLTSHETGLAGISTSVDELAEDFSF